MAKSWLQVLHYEASVGCTIILRRVWKPDNMESGLYLAFEVSPNLAFTGTQVEEVVWKRKVAQFVTKTAAKLTGLREDAFFVVGWSVGPTITVGTAHVIRKRVTV